MLVNRSRVLAVVASMVLAFTGVTVAPARAAINATCTYGSAQGYSLPAMYKITVQSCSSGATIRAGAYYYINSVATTKYGPVWGVSRNSPGVAWSASGPTGSFFAQGTTSA